MLHNITAPLRDGISLDEMFIFIGRLCSQAEVGWWTWHEHLQITSPWLSAVYTPMTLEHSID